MKKKLLIVNGSPRHGSSTEILAEQFELGFRSVIADAEVISVRLNDLDIIPCQSCAVDPRPLLCIYKDELYSYLEHLREADFVSARIANLFRHRVVPDEAVHRSLQLFPAAEI